MANSTVPELAGAAFIGRVFTAGPCYDNQYRLDTRSGLRCPVLTHLVSVNSLTRSFAAR